MVVMKMAIPWPWRVFRSHCGRRDQSLVGVKSKDLVAQWRLTMWMMMHPRQGPRPAAVCRRALNTGQEHVACVGKLGKPAVVGSYPEDTAVGAVFVISFMGPWGGWCMVSALAFCGHTYDYCNGVNLLREGIVGKIGIVWAREALVMPGLLIAICYVSRVWIAKKSKLRLLCTTVTLTGCGLSMTDFHDYQPGLTHFSFEVEEACDYRESFSRQEYNTPCSTNYAA